MRTKDEVIASLADRAYHNHMNGTWFMMSGVDTEMAAWILGEDHDEFYEAVLQEAQFLIKSRNSKLA